MLKFGKGLFGVLDACAEIVQRDACYQPEPRVIMGTSQGGFVALRAMIGDPRVFDGGIIIATPTDLETWKKTEALSRAQLDRIMPFLMNERDDIVNSSPVNHADALGDKAILLLYGTEDKMVPAQQGKLLHNAIKNRNPKARIFYKEYPYGHRLIREDEPQREVARFLELVSTSHRPKTIEEERKAVDLELAKHLERIKKTSTRQDTKGIRL